MLTGLALSEVDENDAPADESSSSSLVIDEDRLVGFLATAAVALAVRLGRSLFVGSGWGATPVPQPAFLARLRLHEIGLVRSCRFRASFRLQKAANFAGLAGHVRCSSSFLPSCLQPTQTEHRTPRKRNPSLGAEADAF